MASTIRSKEAAAKKKRQSERVRFERIGISAKENVQASETLAKFDPVQKYRRERAMAAGRKSHSIGTRR